jgi:hypothetical protein
MTKKVVARDESGQTLLHRACSLGDKSLVMNLIKFGSDINALDNSGLSPLHNAALNGYVDIVSLLLEYGATVNPSSCENDTPLHDACANGYTLCCKLLLEYGADLYCKNIHGKTPKDLVSIDNNELLDLLNLPSETWQPLKTPKFYSRIVKSPEKKNLLVKDEQSKKNSRNYMVTVPYPFAWGGLENREGPFESSREEKKFNALWKSIAKEGSFGASGEVIGVKRQRYRDRDRERNELSDLDKDDTARDLPSNQSINSKNSVQAQSQVQAQGKGQINAKKRNSTTEGY